MKVFSTYKFLSSPRRISLGMAILKLLRAFIAIYTLSLSAKYFGTTSNRDAWVLAITIQTLIIQVLFGPVNEVFRAKYVRINEEEGKKHAIESCSSLLSLFTFVAILIIAVCIFFPQIPAQIFAPGFNAEELFILKFMIRITIPLLIFNELVIIWSAVLNSIESFLLPDIFSLFSGILNIIILVLLAPYIGIYSLVVSVYLTTIPLLCILIVTLKKKNVFLQLKIPVLSEYKPFIVFALPFYLPYSISFVAIAFEKALCSFLPVGSVSVLDYARKFVDLPIGIYMTVIFSILTPILSKYAAQDRKEEYKKEFSNFLRMFLLIFAPFIILLVVCSDNIVIVLLARGKFEPSWIPVTALTITIFGLSIIGIIFYSIIGQALITLKKTKTYAFIAAATQLLPLCLNWLFYKRYGVAFFAFSWGLSHLIFGIVLFFVISIEKQKIIKDIIKIALLYIITGGAVYLVHIMPLTAIFSIALSIATSILVISICLFIFNIEEKLFLHRILMKLRG